MNNIFKEIPEARVVFIDKYIDNILSIYDTLGISGYLKLAEQTTWYWWIIRDFFRLPRPEKRARLKKIFQEERDIKIPEFEKTIVAEMAQNKNSFIKEHNIAKVDAKGIKYKLLKIHHIEKDSVAIIGIPYEKTLETGFDSITKFGKTMEIYQKQSPNLYKDVTTVYGKRENTAESFNF